MSADFAAETLEVAHAVRLYEIEHKHHKPISLTKQFLSGGVGGVALTTTGYPLDTVKVRIQTMQHAAGGQPAMGTWGILRQTVRNEGFFALYRGMSAPVMSTYPMYALCFWGYGVGKNLFAKEDTFTNHTPENLVRIGLAGATSAVFTTPVLCPSERIKCVIQVQGAAAGHATNLTPRECARMLYHEGGISSLFRGYNATLLRDSVASFFYFAAYEYMKKQLTREGDTSPGVGGTLLAGGVAGVINWGFALPLDTLKSKLQVAPQGKYMHGMRSVLAEIMREEGIAGLYRGFTPVMLRAFPSNAACFLGYEMAIKALDRLGVP